MSSLIVSNVSDGTLSIPTTYVTNGSAKAWVNFNGTGTVAIRESFNVASLTDNGTGDYTVNFTTAMPDANFSLAATCNGTAGIVICGSSDVTHSVSFARFRVRAPDAASFFSRDSAFVNASIFR